MSTVALTPDVSTDLRLDHLRALDAETGTEIWKKQIEAHDAARLTGSPVVYDGNVFVPVASWEETRALDPTYPCCTFRGSVVALRIRDGEQVWKAHLVGEPKPTGKTKRGTEQRARGQRNGKHTSAT